ncbi:MAG: hypothetical protein KAH32_05410, partial [Chlamydiia bacterium]|nr:hypothetical protein [Chlamydiia bacterium]
MKISKKEVTAIIDYLEKEKGISREITANIIKESLTVAIEKNKNVFEVEVYIDKQTGVFMISSVREIVEIAEDKASQISLEEVRKLAPTAAIGEYVRAPIDTTILCRSIAHKAWQILRQRIQDKSLEALYKEYKNSSGNVVRGIVLKKLGKRSMLVDIGRMSVVLSHSRYPTNEDYKEGDRVTAVLLEDIPEEEREGDSPR